MYFNFSTPIRSLLACALVLLSSPPGRTNDRQTEVNGPGVDEVLDKYVQAVGGRAAFRKITSRVSKGSFTSTKLGVKGSVELYAKAPNKQLTVLTAAGFGTYRRGFDGATAWEQGPGGDEARESAHFTKRDADFYQAVTLHDVYPRLAFAGREKINGRGAYVLEAPRAGNPKRWYFDAQSGLLLHTEVRGRANNILTSEDYADYRSVDGVLIPFRLRQVVEDGIDFDISLGEVKQNVSIADSIFDEPTTRSQKSASAPERRPAGVSPGDGSARSISKTPSAHEVDDYVEREMKKRRIPGLSLAVLRGGQPLVRQAYGLASVELGVPATVDTVYQLASTTKIFTGTAVMLLVEESKLSLDDRVTKLLPGLPPAWRDITVRHCLTHTSGLPDVVLSDDTDEVIADTLDGALKKLAAMPLASKPGEKWEYNQTGYVLLGMIIEKISGLTFEEFLADRFFRPLGMNATGFGDSTEIVPHRSSLYSLYVLRDKKLVDSPDKVHAAQFLYPAYTYTGAGLNTTIGDMAKWDAALSAGKVLKPATLDAMWTATKLNDGTTFRLEGSTLGYGGGWLVDDTPGHKSVGHTGGAATAYIRYLDDKLSVIVLTNCQGARPEELAQGVAALYAPALAEEKE